MGLRSSILQAADKPIALILQTKHRSISKSFSGAHGDKSGAIYLWHYSVCWADMLCCSEASVVCCPSRENKRRRRKKKSSSSKCWRNQSILVNHVRVLKWTLCITDWAVTRPASKTLQVRDLESFREQICTVLPSFLCHCLFLHFFLFIFFF